MRKVYGLLIMRLVYVRVSTSCREHFSSLTNNSYIYGHAERTLRKLET
jgi:hypothetical protein